MAPHVLLTSRYGISKSQRPDLEHFAARHQVNHQMEGDGCEAAERFRCRCSGNLSNRGVVPRCCGRMTGEDFRCDECREWCYAVDEDHNKYPFMLV